MDAKKYDECKEWIKEYYIAFEKAVDVIQEKYSPGYDSHTKFDWDFDTNVAYAEFERHSSCGCCGSDYDGAELPMDIATPEGLEKYICERDEEIKKEKKNEKARKKREAKQKKEAAEKARRKQYEALKAEYGD